MAVPSAVLLADPSAVRRVYLVNVPGASERGRGVEEAIRSFVTGCCNWMGVLDRLGTPPRISILAEDVGSKEQLMF